METVIGEVSTMQKKDNEQIKVDPFGSYTGRPIDLDETPVQDADDL